MTKRLTKHLLVMGLTLTALPLLSYANAHASNVSSQNNNVAKISHVSQDQDSPNYQASNKSQNQAQPSAVNFWGVKTYPLIDPDSSSQSFTRGRAQAKIKKLEQLEPIIHSTDVSNNKSIKTNHTKVTNNQAKVQASTHINKATDNSIKFNSKVPEIHMDKPMHIHMDQIVPKAHKGAQIRKPEIQKHFNHRNHIRPLTQPRSNKLTMGTAISHQSTNTDKASHKISRALHINNHNGLNKQAAKKSRVVRDSAAVSGVSHYHHMMSIAQSKLGDPYVWGGIGKNAFDCSGFTQYLYEHGKHVILPRTAGAQYDATKRVSEADAQPGDLVFFGSPSYIEHVGMYIGHGEMVDAQLRGVIIEHIHEPWWSLVGFGHYEG